MRALLIHNPRSKAIRAGELLASDAKLQVDTATEIKTIKELLTGQLFDVILVEYHLQFFNATKVCKYIRKQGITTPVIVISKGKSQKESIDSIYAGADDYLPAPFAIEELLTRIHSAVRRATMYGNQKTELKVCGLEFDLRTRRLKSPTRSINLTSKESQLLEYLVLNQDTAVSRENIFQSVWQTDRAKAGNRVDVYINYLRKKLNSHFGYNVIETVRGIGYILRSQPPKAA